MEQGETPSVLVVARIRGVDDEEAGVIRVRLLLRTAGRIAALCRYTGARRYRGRKVSSVDERGR